MKDVHIQRGAFSKNLAEDQIKIKALRNLLKPQFVLSSVRDKQTRGFQTVKPL